MKNHNYLSSPFLLDWHFVPRVVMKTAIPSSLPVSGILSAPVTTMRSSATSTSHRSSSAMKPNSLACTPLIHGKPYSLATKIMAAYCALDTNRSQFKVQEQLFNKQAVSPCSCNQKESLLVAMKLSSNHINTEMASTVATFALYPSASLIKSKPKTVISSSIQPKTFMIKNSVNSEMESFKACQPHVNDFSSSNDFVSNSEQDTAAVKAIATPAVLPTITTIATEVSAVNKQGSQPGLFGPSFIRGNHIGLNCKGTKSWKTHQKRLLLPLLSLRKPILTVISLLILSSVTTADNVMQHDHTKPIVLLDQAVCDHNIC